jgi:hypothetical protein
MPDASVPYYLKPKATKLAEGPDVSLDPPVAPTDAERRGIPPIFWAAMDKSKGGTAPQDAPLAPPAMDPALRSLEPFIWPRGGLSNRALRELGVPVPDLDPDIALWPVTTLSRWPFAGHPTVGIWPKGWLGVDNTATVWVCVIGGEPGTWLPLSGGGGGGAFPTFTGSGSPQGVTTATAVGQTYQDTVRGGIWVAGAAGNNHWAQVGGRDPASGTLVAGVFVDAPSNAGAWLITDASAGAHLSDVAGFAGTGNGVEWSAGASDGSQSFSVQVGSSGQFTLVLSQLGVFHVPAALVLDAIPTTDPAVTDEVWNDNGRLVMSGFAPPGTALAGHLASNYPVTTGLATFLTTASLAPGTWLVTLGSQVLPGTGSAVVEIEAVAGTATATFEGQTANTTSGSEAASAPLSFIATVTVAGTLAFQAIATTTSGTPTIYAASFTNSYPRATGWTAVRIA